MAPRARSGPCGERSSAGVPRLGGEPIVPVPLSRPHPAAHHLVRRRLPLRSSDSVARAAPSRRRRRRWGERKRPPRAAAAPRWTRRPAPPRHAGEGMRRHRFEVSGAPSRGPGSPRGPPSERMACWTVRPRAGKENFPELARGAPRTARGAAHLHARVFERTYGTPERGGDAWAKAALAGLAEWPRASPRGAETHPVYRLQTG